MTRRAASLPSAASRSLLTPELVVALRDRYSWRAFASDLVAGITVGVVALPLSIAFAIASGVKPEQGLATAVIAGAIIAALGGSRVQIGGPTGAFVVIVAGTVEAHGYEGLAIATLMAGVLLLVMGFARLGAVIRFVPYPVTVGFTTGIALYIAVSQLRDLLGLEMGHVPSEFVEKVSAYADHIGTWSPAALSVGAVTVAIVGWWPRITRRVPGSIVAIVITTIVVQLAGLDVETIGTRFGGVPRSLPPPRIPVFDLATLRELSSSALAIAFLGGIESLLSAVVADGMTGHRHRPNTELIAQGIANIASPLFGGIPATGAIARTATNVRSGGRTPVAGIVHAVTLWVILVAVAPWASLIPLPALAGILLVVAYHMSEWRFFVRLFRAPPQDVAVLLVTFALTVFVDLVVAIEVGMVLAALLFMHRMATLSGAELVTGMLRDAGERGPDRGVTRAIPAGVEVFEVAGSFFFGAASKFQDALGRIETPPRVLILRLRDVPFIDATGLRALEILEERSRRDGTRLILSGLREEPRTTLARSGFLGRLGPENVALDLDDALDAVEGIVRGSE